MMNLRQCFENVPVAVFVAVYLSFLLDNVLLTAVVPIIPDYLFSSMHNSNVSTIIDDTESLSPLQRKYSNIEQKNGPIGALLSSKAFVQLAFTPLVGYLTGILGYQLLLLLGNTNMLLASLLFAFGDSYVVLVLARALHGAASATISVSGMSLLASSLAPEPRFRLMPIAFGGIALGVLIGYPLGGAAYELLGKTAPFVLIAAAIAINICVIMRRFQIADDDITEPVSEDDQCVAKASLNWNEIVGNRAALICCGSICVSTTCMAVLEPCVPVWLMVHMNPPPTKWQLGAVFIPDSVGYFLGSHFAGLLPIFPWRVSLIGMLLTGIGSLSLPLADNIAQLTVPHFCIGLGVGTVDAALVPYLAHLVDSSPLIRTDLDSGTSSTRRQYGVVYALQQAAVSTAYAFGPLLGGEMVQSGIGFGWLMRIVGSMNVLYTPLLLELEKIKDSGYILKHDSLPSYSSFDQENNW